MSEDSLLWLEAGRGKVGVNLETGVVEAMRTSGPDIDFIAGPSTTSGLLRMAHPLEDNPSHYLELGTHGRPQAEQRDDGLTLVFDGLTSDFAHLDVRVQIDMTSTPDGLVIRARVENKSDQDIPQIAFPQLLGLETIGSAADCRLQLGRRQVKPFEELTARPDDVTFLDLHLQEYIRYGADEFNMKWFDYGSTECGLTVYSRNSKYTVQGLALDRASVDTDELDLRWVHHPYVAPGETWDSGEYVFLLHSGDWFSGARAYQGFARTQYPYRGPKHIREALGVRSVWPAVRSSSPTFALTELPKYAQEIADPDLGIAEMVMWHWWLKNGYPIIVDKRLGTEEELSAALAECRELGVPISLFVSHHILRTTDETDPEWVHRNAAGQEVTWNWTYGPGFLPRFGVHFIGSHSMVRGSALSPGWRETGLEEYRKIIQDYGADSICFDVYYAWDEPNYSAGIDGRRDEEGEKLLEFGRAAREIIHAANPNGTFSGEYISDVSVPVADYSWDWRSGHDMPASAAFRYVFPEFRLNANVSHHPRGALLGFMEGALLNLMPGDMRTRPLADFPELMATIRKLAGLRRKFLRYFTEGQFRYVEGLRIDGCDARVYTHGEDILIIAANPHDTPNSARISVDPSAWGVSTSSWSATTYTMEAELESPSVPATIDTAWDLTLGPDDLRIIELLAK
jgi:hypothetical protein